MCPFCLVVVGYLLHICESEGVRRLLACFVLITCADVKCVLFRFTRYCDHNVQHTHLHMPEGIHISTNARTRLYTIS